MFAPFCHKYDVISQDFCYDVKLFHLLKPRPHMQTDEHHGEGTTLRDATWPAMGSPDAAIYAVVTFEAFRKLRVGSKDLLGHPRHFGDFV